MSKQAFKLPRRRFLKNVFSAAGAAVMAPTIIPSSALGLDGAVPPSERVVVGGIAGGIVVFLLMGAANHLFLGQYWKNWMAAMGPMLHFAGPRRSLALWLGQSLVTGLGGTAVYAGIRPRYGAGSMTALWAGFLVWFVADLGQMLNALAIGDLPRHIIAGECLAGFVATLAGTWVGAAIYKE